MGKKASPKQISQANPNEIPKLVALCGLAGSGKSTCSEFLAREWGYEILKFASPLKEMLRVLGLTDEHLDGSCKEDPCEQLAGNSPRHAMQTLGTEWGRAHMGQNFWADMWSQAASRAIQTGRRVVVDDCRFPNELEAVQKLGGVAIEILRPGLVLVPDHESERHRLPTDLKLLNDQERDSMLSQLCGLLGLSM